jgi:hypothetical protein
LNDLIRLRHGWLMNESELPCHRKASEAPLKDLVARPQDVGPSTRTISVVARRAGGVRMLKRHANRQAHPRSFSGAALASG